MFLKWYQQIFFFFFLSKSLTCNQQTQRMNPSEADSPPFLGTKSVAKLSWKRICSLKNPQQQSWVEAGVHYCKKHKDTTPFVWGDLNTVLTLPRRAQRLNQHKSFSTCPRGLVVLKRNFHSGIHTNMKKKKNRQFYSQWIFTGAKIHNSSSIESI